MWAFAGGTSLIAAWIGFRVVLLWDQYGLGFPESWRRRPYWVVPLIAAIGWIAYFAIFLG